MVREKRLKDVEEDMADLNERISFKDKRISGCLAVSNYKKCDEIKEEIIQLKKQLRELEAEKSVSLYPAVNQSGIIEINMLQVILVLTIQLPLVVILNCTVILQHRPLVQCQIPQLMSPF